MAEYIKKEDVLKLLEKNSITKKITLADGISIYDSVKNAPTADVVEVVRCKDCKWFSVHNKDGCYRPDLDHHAQMTPVYEDDFCSYGTPKERGGEK